MEAYKRGPDNSVIKTTVSEVLSFLKNSSIIELDTETTGFDPHSDKILCIQFGNTENQYLLSWDNTSSNLLKPFLEDSSKLFILQNAKFDLQFLYKNSIVLSNIYDTFLAESILKCGYVNSPKNLKYLIEKYLGIYISKEIREDIPELGLTEAVIDYALDDVKYLTRIMNIQMESIREYELENALALDNRFVKTLAYVEFCGMGFDKELWLKKSQEDLDGYWGVNENKEKEYYKGLLELEQEMNELVIKLGLKNYYNFSDLFCTNPIVIDGVGYSTTINWSSDKQVGKLFKELGIDITIEEDGEIKESVGVKVLSQKKGEHPLVGIYAKWVKKAKLISSFGKSYLRFINPSTNRIHTTYKQILNTGRMSSGNTKQNKPNLQQVPSDERHRHCFISEEGNDLIAADYSGMESVIFANKTLDKGLLDFYDNGYGDMHSYVAKLCFKDDLEGIEVDDVKKHRKDLRQKAKGAGFAIQFGGVGFTISANLGISPEEGEQVYQAYMNAFTGVKDYFSEISKKALKDGYVEFNDITKRKNFFDFYDDFKKVERRVLTMDWKEYREHKNSNSIDFINYYQPTVKSYFKWKGMIERRSYNFPI